jgi:xylulokinase
VLGLPLELVEGEAGSALGGAFVAGKAVGTFKGWEEIASLVKAGPVVEPNDHAHRRYEELFALYRESYERLRAIYPRLAGFGGATTH